MATPIIIRNLTKKFGNVVAVNNVSLTIEPGAFLTLLGPSGCGKTTLLRCISGLEDPDDGEIVIGEHDPPRPLRLESRDLRGQGDR